MPRYTPHPATAAISIALAMMTLVQTARAASSWNPTLLVNTEAFQVVDAGDGSTNIEFRFGESNNRRLYYDLSGARFTFTQSVFVQGNLTTTGSVSIRLANPTAVGLSVSGTMSGSKLRIDNLAASGALVYSSGSSLRNTARGSSGNLLISQGNRAPVWKAPVGSLVWYKDGGLAVTGSGSAVVTMPFGMTATSVSLHAKAAPTGANIIVDINKNGTTIFSTRPAITAGSKTGGSNAVFSITDLPEGSVLTMDIDQVGSALVGSGLTIMLNGTRKY